MAEGTDSTGLELALRKLIQTHGVTGYVILNSIGIPVHKHGMEDPRAIQMGGLFSELKDAASRFLVTQQSRMQSDSQSEDDASLFYIRLRTNKKEYIVCPEDDYTLIVVHSPDYEEPEEEHEEEEEGEEEDN